MPHCSRERSLQRKALQCAGNSTARQTRRQPLGHGLGATLLPFQRASERAGITQWPFHGVTASAGHSLFSQVGFVHKNISWNLKGQAQLHVCDKGSVCSFVGIHAQSCTDFSSTVCKGGHKYDSYVSFLY